MPNSLKCRLKNLVRNGLLRECDLERIIIIPPNATNGETLEKVFPNLVDHCESHVEKWIAVDTDLVSNEEWLNTPYKIDREAAAL